MKASLQQQPMYCSRDHNYSSRFNQQYEKSTQNSLLIKEYLLFVPVHPYRLGVFTKMVRAKDLMTRGSKDLSASCIILNSVLSFVDNIFLAEGICSVCEFVCGMYLVL